MEVTPARFLLQPPVFHPVVPYITTVFGGLYHGKIVLLQGRVPNDAQRFQVDFQCGCSMKPQADIGFHFNPRFHSVPHVICNALQDERWMEEQKSPGLPLKGGDAFQLLFVFLQERVQVSVNRRHFLEYRYRLPLERMDTLGVFGDVSVRCVAFLNSNPFTEERTVCEPLLLNSPELALPVSRPLSGGLVPGYMITVRGLVHQDPEEISLALTSKSGRDLVKLSVCFREKELRWSCSPAGGKQEKVSLTFFPFHALRFCEILLLCEAKRVRLAVNGGPLGEFHPPDLSLLQAIGLRVSGSVDLYSIQC
ncbi:galectin-12 isoform X2 [Rhinatrema bivittatum]|uniref:galectin-12 isoform X2 n=1 Tax=Rhinatrema bivittatum TaxID=194408 RepID=UPI00112A2F68|nr:galectin-12 isoform X2 [Rhinatrema bivittatum]